jgi:hypothetical protein
MRTARVRPAKEKEMSIYGKAALKAVELYKNGVELYKNGVEKDPVQAWQSAIAQFTDSPNSRDKASPRSTFLGLCEEGLVSGIPPDKYTKSVKNTAYALRAVAALRNDPALARSSSALWNSIETDAENDQGGMGVVIALWNAKLINNENGTGAPREGV